MKRILFIQHASAFGGSVMSLLYTLEGIKKAEGKDVQLIVSLAKWTKELDDFYSNEGFEVVNNKWIDTYEHTQLVSYNLLNPLNIVKELKQIIKLIKAKKNTIELINRVKPDIVHLNSVVLLGSAIGLSVLRQPFVWHVREPSIKGFLGIRRKILKNALAKLPGKCIFICYGDKTSWGNPKNGKVIYNFIDLNKFKPSAQKESRVKNIPIPADSFNILFLGGVNKVKGGIVIIKALAIVVRENPDIKIRLLFAGGEYVNPNYFLIRFARAILPLFGMGTHSQLVKKTINQENLDPHIISFPYEKKIYQLFNVSNVLVFPSIRPHFARPIIEAGAMKIPVIGSDLDGVSELINDEVNGFKIMPKSERVLADKLNLLIRDKNMCEKMGVEGYNQAIKKFDQRLNVEQILAVYNEVLN
jgi:glycosyltransferase involved in cell wall biosynthesis